MNAFLIERLAIQLQAKLVGKRLTELFTTSQFDLYLIFEEEGVKMSFFQGQAFFQTPDLEKLQKKNRLPVFRSLKGVEVSKIVAFPYDRRFDIVFADQQVLAFYLFGKFAQLTHYRSNSWQEAFPVKTSKVETYEVNTWHLEDKKVSNLRFLNENERLHLASQSFDEIASSEKDIALNRLKNDVLKQTLFLNKGVKKYTLDYEVGAEPIAQFDEITQALDQYARLYISHQVYTQTKGSHLGQLQKELSALEKKVKSAQKRLEELNRASSYKQKADLLMANLWQINKGVQEVKLLSFEGTHEVVIKLQNTLSPQANAERYYTKGKNESKQRDFALKHLVEVKHNYLAKAKEIDSFESVDNLKEIRKTADLKLTQKEKRVPYKTMHIDGFEIRIGKGARENDDLLRYHTTNSDTWLHAKDVSGSHVIIRNPNNTQILPATLEKVASIAAFYSKAKSESLAAVIYTPRKYIRKPKGATPGLVKVDKEEVILVEPKLNF
jgi:predicted ribosome quality control (RQC) complex YloA/Tae2 family protein